MDLDKLSISGELISKAIVGMKTRALAYGRQGRDNCIFIGLDGERLSAADLTDCGPCRCNNVGQASNHDLGSDPIRQFHGRRGNFALTGTGPKPDTARAMLTMLI